MAEENKPNLPPQQAKMKENSILYDIGSYLWGTIIKPTGKNLLYNVVNETARISLFGANGRPASGNVTQRNTQIAPNGYYDYTTSTKARVVNQPQINANNAPVATNVSKYAVCNIEVPNYGDVEDIKYLFSEVLEDRPCVSAATFYSLLRDRIPSCESLPVLNSSYYGYGWTPEQANLVSSRSNPNQAGWFTITLPKLVRVIE